MSRAVLFFENSILGENTLQRIINDRTHENPDRGRGSKM